MNIFIFFIITVLFKLFDFIIAFVTPQFIHSFNTFTFNNINQPAFLDAFANFDGIHYMDIAKRGYIEPGEFAFFPLYPLLIRLVQFITFNNYFVAGILISFISITVALFFLNKYLKSIGMKQNSILWTFIFLLSFPTSFYLNAVYTESLFLLLVLLSFYYLKNNRYMLVILFSFLAALTRLSGLFLCIPIFIHVYKEMDKKMLMTKKNLQLFITSISPILGLFTFSAYLWFMHGDAFKFISAAKTYGEQRSSTFILFPQVMYRYLKIFITAQHNFQYFIAVVEFIIFTSFLAILCYGLVINFKKRKDIYLSSTLGLFSLINLLLPTVTGSFSSVPRYVLPSLYVFIFLSRIKSVAIKIPIVIIFALFHIILLAYFVQGYFVS